MDLNPFARISLGCHNLTGGSSSWRSQRLVRTALDHGIMRFDVAPSYGLGTAEATLAHALGPNRHDPRIEITTKFGIPRPRNGVALAWLREPYRFAGALIGRRASSGVLSTGSAYSGIRANLIGSPDKSLQESLSRLRIDSVSCYLTHELLLPPILDEFQEFAELWIKRGRVRRVGCSGAITAVQKCLSSIGDNASVAQVSLLNADVAFAERVEVRHFHLATFARQICAHLNIDRFRDLRSGLAHISANRLAAEPLPALAATLALSLRHWPARNFLINASSGERLADLVKMATSREIEVWADEARAAGLANDDPKR